MKEISGFKFLVLLSILFIAGCAPKAKISSIQTPVAMPIALEDKQGWEREWEMVTKKGREEGRVVLYTGWRPSVRKAIGEAFKAKHEIEIEFIAGRGIEVLGRLLRERKAGIYYADFYISGGADNIMLSKAGILSSVVENFILPEVKDSKVWMDGTYPFLDKEGLIFYAAAFDSSGDPITYNTQMVKKEEIKSWKDLLNPKFRGNKIAMNDPTTTGRGANLFAVGMEFLGREYWKELARQQVILTRDLQLLTDWLAKGKYAVAIGAVNEIYNEYIKAGAPIAVLEELADNFYYISLGSSNISIPSNPPHPNATKTFLNWFLTKEPQTIFVRETDWQSTRLDVPTNIITPHRVRKPGIKYFRPDTEEFLEKRNTVFLQDAKEIFAP